MPYLLRDQINWSTNEPARWRALTRSGLLYGAAIAALSRLMRSSLVEPHSRHPRRRDWRFHPHLAGAEAPARCLSQARTSRSSATSISSRWRKSDSMRMPSVRSSTVRSRASSQATPSFRSELRDYFGGFRFDPELSLRSGRNLRRERAALRCAKISLRGPPKIIGHEHAACNWRARWKSSDLMSGSGGEIFPSERIENLRVDSWRIASRRLSRFIPAAEAKRRTGRSRIGSNLAKTLLNATGQSAQCICRLAAKPTRKQMARCEHRLTNEPRVRFAQIFRCRISQRSCENCRFSSATIADFASGGGRGSARCILLFGPTDPAFGRRRMRMCRSSGVRLIAACSRIDRAS